MADALGGYSKKGTAYRGGRLGRAIALFLRPGQEQLKPFTAQYCSHPSGEPERLRANGHSSTWSGGVETKPPTSRGCLLQMLLS